MLALLRNVLLQRKIAPQTRRIFARFLSLKGVRHKSLEFSSDSTQKAGGDYVRAILLCLDSSEVLQVLKGCSRARPGLEETMRWNPRESCFGIGISDYISAPMESCFKVYHFYDQSGMGQHPRGHIPDICRRSGLSYSDVKWDLLLLGKIPFVAVDYYEDASAGIKVYSQRCLTRNLLAQYGSLFDAGTLGRYRDLLRVKALPPVVSLCLRYGRTGRSIRTDFLCNSRKVDPYLTAFDPGGSARRLYDELSGAVGTVKLTYITMDLDKRPRTQFYFDVD